MQHHNPSCSFDTLQFQRYYQTGGWTTRRCHRILKHHQAQHIQGIRVFLQLLLSA